LAVGHSFISASSQISEAGGELGDAVVDPSRARRIVDEIAGVVRVMDQVLTAQAPRPPAA
jgi:hypothetical protein